MNYQSFVKQSESDSSLSSEELDNLFNGFNFSQTKAIKGFTVASAAIFLTAQMAGLGVLALPHAIGTTGWWGLGLVALICFNSCYCAMILGNCWILMEERWEEYTYKIRYPYPAIGLRAVGSWMRYVVSITLHITLFGIATVYIILGAQVTFSLTKNHLKMPWDYWMLLWTLILCPLTWLGSIEKFRFAGYGAFISAVVACWGLFISILTNPHDKRTETPPSFGTNSLAFGTIIFAFGGIFFFPTIQNEMANRKDFQKASLLGFGGLMVLYLPATLASYCILGSNVPKNFLMAVAEGYWRNLIEVSIVIHVLLAFLLFMNPVAEEIEEALGIEKDFSWKRCCARTIIMAFIVLIANTVPHFDKIMNLIGGSTVTLLTFIFPPLLYIALCKTKEITERRIGKLEMFFFMEIILTGIAGGIACTYFAITDITDIFKTGKSDDPLLL